MPCQAPYGATVPCWGPWAELPPAVPRPRDSPVSTRAQTAPPRDSHAPPRSPARHQHPPQHRGTATGTRCDRGDLGTATGAASRARWHSVPARSRPSQRRRPPPCPHGAGATGVATSICARRGPAGTARARREGSAADSPVPYKPALEAGPGRGAGGSTGGSHRPPGATAGGTGDTGGAQAPAVPGDVPAGYS